MVRRAFEALTEGKVPTRLVCFSDDMDGLRKVPTNVPNQAELAAHLDKPLTRVPDPFGQFESFAHHNNAMLRRFLDRFGFEYEFYSATECYTAGKFDATLRRMLTAACEIVPGLDTAVLQGPRPLAHQSLLAEEGIRVAAVDTAADAGRGGRRPAPAGWRCRNPVWGLWEVQVDPAQPVGWMGWLRSGPLPRPRPGMLHVLHAGAVSAEQPGAGRLGRWLGWAAGQTAAGRLRLTGLGTLPAILARGESQPISGSVLKAA
jgi:hypothetical protein